MQPRQAIFRSHLDVAFEKYHNKNPHIYELFKTFAFRVKLAGRNHYGAKTIIERIRYHVDIERPTGRFKINNNFTSRYVRKLEKECPEFKGFFEKRRLH